MKKEIKITWEKWESLIEDQDEEEGHYQDSYSEHQNTMVPQPNPIMMTPMGAIPIPSAGSDNFNFWLGHTNFTLDAPLEKIIESVEGVETLDVFTRYRMRISVGKQFEDRQVCNDIKVAASGYFKNYPKII